MPCERADQPLSCSTLEDTGAPALMEIMMPGSPEDICLIACSPQSPRTRGGPGAAPSREREPEPWGHVAAPELLRAGSRSPNHEDTWRPRSYPEPGMGARAARTRCSFGAALSREAGADALSLYAGVPDPHGTDKDSGQGCFELKPSSIGTHVLLPKNYLFVPPFSLL
jgi:hypothetical protein